MQKKLIKGTFEALLSQVERWHRQLGKEEKEDQYQWDHCVAINDFYVEKGKDQNFKIYRITELLSSKELSIEGRAMKHCVSSYAHSCCNGRCSIWSLYQEDYSGQKKLITIEINRNNIAQIRGKNNRYPTYIEMEIINEWALKEHLVFSKYIKTYY